MEQTESKKNKPEFRKKNKVPKNLTWYQDMTREQKEEYLNQKRIKHKNKTPQEKAILSKQQRQWNTNFRTKTKQKIVQSDSYEILLQALTDPVNLLARRIYKIHEDSLKKGHVKPIKDKIITLIDEEIKRVKNAQGISVLAPLPFGMKKTVPLDLSCRKSSIIEINNSKIVAESNYEINDTLVDDSQIAEKTSNNFRVASDKNHSFSVDNNIIRLNALRVEEQLLNPVKLNYDRIDSFAATCSTSNTHGAQMSFSATKNMHVDIKEELDNTSELSSFMLPS